MEKRPKKDIPTGEWLNTYADMITLILCFFVLLYSMSTVDAVKWENLVKSLNPNAKEVKPPVQTGDKDGAEVNEEQISFEDIYALIQQSIEQQQLHDQMEAFKGEGFAFVVFEQSILFDGDSYVLKPSAMSVLDNFALVMEGKNDVIGEIRVLGHTTQALPDVPNTVEGDRFLASNRATQVVVYLQKKGIIDARKFVPVGLGQHYNISPFDTEENRSKNRRVEILISDTNNVNIALDKVYESIGVKLQN